jgi:hypothetical protein
MEEKDKEPSFLAKWFMACWWPGFGYALMSTCLIGIPLHLIGFSTEDIQLVFMLSIPAWALYWVTR